MNGRNLAYHLRPNKVVDRLIFIEAIKRMGSCLNVDSNKSRYYGMGGPFLEDLKAIYGSFPDIELSSIEQDFNVHKRQSFHSFKAGIDFFHGTYHEWMVDIYEPKPHDIIWADYTSSLTPDILSDFGETCFLAGRNTIIKVTVNMSLVSADKNHSRYGSYFDTFGEYALPVRKTGESIGIGEWPEKSLDSKDEYAGLLLEMFKKAAEKYLPIIAGSNRFTPIQCVRYADAAPMFCITGVVCPKDCEDILNREFGAWQFGTGKKEKVLNVTVPDLSIKERLAIESLIPPNNKWVKDIRDILGYALEDDDKKARQLIWDYCRFSRFHANFARMEM